MSITKGSSLTGSVVCNEKLIAIISITGIPTVIKIAQRHADFGWRRPSKKPPMSKERIVTVTSVTCRSIQPIIIPNVIANIAQKRLRGDCKVGRELSEIF